MAGFVPNVDPIFLIQRKGTKEDPYLPLKEDKIVYKTPEKYSVTLSEIPNFQNKVKVKGLDGKYLTEIFDFNATLNASQYYVDYTSGIVYFHSSNDNKQFNFDYLGMGNINFPSSRIVMQGGTKTLQDLAKEMETSKTNWLTPPLATLNDVKAKYPSPKIGDTIMTTSDAKIYRYEATGWILTQAQSDTAVADLQNKSSETNGKIGNLSQLKTDNKQNLTDATNEVITNLGKVSKNNLAVLTFTFDDGYKEDNLTYSIFKEYGLTCGFAIITDRLLWTSKNPIDKYRQYQNEGFSILSHAANHIAMSDGNMPMNQAEYEINNSFKDLSTLGLKVNGFATPISTLNAKYMPLLSQNYTYAFTKYTGALPTSNIGHVLKDANPYNLGRVSLLNNSVEQIKAAIDNAIDKMGFLAFYEHRTGHPDGITEAKLREILSYVKSKVDNGSCLVLNPDDAVNQYFGKTNRNNAVAQNRVRTNLAPSITEFVTAGSSYDSWYFSMHQASQGETITASSPTVPHAEINYPRGAIEGTINSLQARIYLGNTDKNNIRNKTIYFSHDMWASNDADLFNVEMRCRFYQADGTYPRTHSVPITITENKSKYEAAFTIIDEVDLTAEYALVYVQFTTKSAIPANTKIYFNNPVIGVGVKADDNIVRVNKPFTLKLSSPVELGVNLGNRVWSNYKTTDRNNFIEGLSDGTGTFTIKETGLYSFNFNFNLDVNNSTQTSFPRVMIEVSTVRSFGSDVNSRTEHFYKMPSATFSVLTNYTLWLRAGERLSVKLWFDSVDGTCVERTTATCRTVKLI